jgi:ferredoxin
MPRLWKLDLLGDGSPGRRRHHGIVKRMRVWVDQDRCTGDGLCVQYAPDVFEFDIDGLAYVKDRAGTLLTAPGTRTEVPEHLRLAVVDSVRECPGECIHLEPAPGTQPA